MTKHTKIAFTLAEVLITLGIIGIVAAITIPTIIQNTQKQEIKSAWKENYSIVNQATMQIKADNGGSLIGVFTGPGTQMDLYADKLKTIGKCTTGSCPFTTTNVCGGPGQATLTMTNGVVLTTCANAGIMGSGSCANDSWGLANFGQNICAEFYVDVNGSKGPNTSGQDIFWMGVGADKTFPGGSSGISNAIYKCPGGTYCNSFNYLYQ